MAQQPDQQPPEPAVTPGKGRARRWWQAALAGTMALVCVLGWLSASQRGFATLWRVLGWSSNGALTVEQVDGTLWQGFSLKGLHYVDGTRSIDVDRLSVDWQPRALWQRRLQVQLIDVGLVRVEIRAPGRASPWPTLPEQLTWPLDVRIQRLRVAGITLEPLHGNAYALDASYGYDGRRHDLSLRSLRLADGDLNGRMQLSASRPFAVNANLQFAAASGQANLSARGSLQQLRVSGRVHAQPLHVDLDGLFSPFDALPFQRIRQLTLVSQAVDPAALNTAWPHAALDLRAEVNPDRQHGARGILNVHNRLPGPWSGQRLPLSDARLAFVTDGRTLQIADSWLNLMRGKVALNGTAAPDRLALAARVSALELNALDARAPRDMIDGQLTLNGAPRALILSTRLNGRWLRAEGELALSRQTSGWAAALKRLQLAAGTARMNLNGSLGAAGTYDMQGQLLHIDPSRFRPGWPVGDINGQFQARGALGPRSSARVQLKFTPSRLSSAPLQGALDLDWSAPRLSRIAADLNLAGNHLSAHGAYGARGDRLQVALNAPALASLGFGFSGRANGRLDLSGAPAMLQLDASLQAQQLRLPGLFSAGSLNLSGKMRGDAAAPLALAVIGEQLAGDGWKVERLQLNASGRRARHSIILHSQQTLAGQSSRLSAEAVGGWGASGPWRGVLRQARLDGSPGFTLLAPLPLEVGAERQQLGATRVALLGGVLTLDRLVHQAGGRLESQGRAQGLQLVQLQPWLGLPLHQDLQVDAAWQLSPDGRGRLMLTRRGGDAAWPLDKGAQALGISQAKLALEWFAGRTHLEFDLASRLANMHAQGEVPALPYALHPDTPLSMRLQLALPDLSGLSAVSGGEAVMAGTLAADLQLSGPLGRPGARGTLSGHNLLWQDRKTGVRLSSGELAAHLDGRRLALERLRFAAGEGEVLASGQADFASATPTANIKVDIRHFSVFDRADRRLVVSGNAVLSVTEKMVSLTGLVRADKGRLSLPKEGTPALSDDVVVKGRAAPEPSAFARLPLSVALTLDLGDHFALNGQGLNVALSGRVDVKAHQGMAPSAHGQVQIVKGSYKAYGQELDIESGTITFVGPLNNPNLNVRARRHLSTVGAGVEVLGSVAEPRLQLIADETLSERDKLSWLVLGHAASDNAQDSNMLALAASTMAVGQVNQQIGLFDDLGVVRHDSRTALNGTVSPAEQVLTVGKQLTRTFYLGYEYGLSSSQQAVKLIYQLTSKWSVVLRAGANASAESRYTLRFD